MNDGLQKNTILYSHQSKLGKNGGSKAGRTGIIDSVNEGNMGYIIQS